ncbi:hypothetical protein [Nitrosomonas sp. Is37]|uniref:hypothetical protein n=1 Tax=Nitrosomonas sp. Is37 TaxID=3080535 RepID=UPI00294AB8D2|nr:hypothetical protein [Nitrosomonas sp. Is37]MDV6344701.1 hypothetical protein [Nitrosomonas sp. Is37]
MDADPDCNKSVLINPLPIIMVILLAISVLIKNIQLESARPSDVEWMKFVPIKQQSTDAL